MGMAGSALQRAKQWNAHTADLNRGDEEVELAHRHEQTAGPAAKLGFNCESHIILCCWSHSHASCQRGIELLTRCAGMGSPAASRSSVGTENRMVRFYERGWLEIQPRPTLRSQSGAEFEQMFPFRPLMRRNRSRFAKSSCAWRASFPWRFFLEFSLRRCRS